MNRLQLRRTRGWRKPEGAVVVSRPGLWGNPWVVGTPGRLRLPMTDGTGHRVTLTLPGALSAELAVSLHWQWLERLLIAAPFDLDGPDPIVALRRLANRRLLILESLPALRGRDLLCFCPPGAPCHGDTLLAMANA